MHKLTRDRADDSRKTWIRETRFGRWFLGTNVWFRYILVEAVRDFDRMLGANRPAVNRLLDAGCGTGLAFPLLEQYFQPGCIVGADIDSELIELAAISTRQCGCEVILDARSVVDLDFPDGFFDMIFCHQLLHHCADQEGALRQFHRLLVPGGAVLIGESCRPFIQSLPVRLLFRHPMSVQKTAQEYVELVKAMGFEIGHGGVEMLTPWWSRRDLGLLERLGVSGEKPSEVTEVLIVARKPKD